MDPRLLGKSAIEIAIKRTASRYVQGAVAKVPNIMDEPYSNPAFEARRLKSACGWYVRVAWPNGKRDHIPGFISQHEAQCWIEGKAPAWLSERSNAHPVSFGRLATAS